MSGPHALINPPALPPPSGFSHAVVARGGRTVYLAGQVGSGSDGNVVSGGLCEQFAAALDNLLTALAAAEGHPDDLVFMQIFVLDLQEYRSRLRELGVLWRRQVGTHYPALGLFEVGALFDRTAVVELMAVAVITERP